MILGTLFNLIVFGAGFWAGGYFKGDVTALKEAVKAKLNSWFSSKP